MQVDLKRIKPLGVVLILGCAILALIVCFTGDLKIPEAYTPAHPAEYYRQNADTLQELAEELKTAEFPRVDGEESCEADLENLLLLVTTDQKYVKQLQAVLNRDFGAGLITVKGR